MTSSRFALAASDGNVVVGAEGVLAMFNDAGVLSPLDVSAAVTIGRLLHEPREEVQLAAALAVRGTRFGHVCIRLDAIRDAVVVDGQDLMSIEALPWPEFAAWEQALSSSPLVGDGSGDHPLVLAEGRLYLERYFRYEAHVARLIAAGCSRPPKPLTAAMGQILDELLSPPAPGEDVPDRQRQAAVAALTGGFTVIAGGPGTGKTHTVGAILAALAAGDEFPSVALCAPTGKAAARLGEAINEVAAMIPDERIAKRLRTVVPSTIHRLLGWRWGRGQFVHDAGHRLPHDLVIVDEMSMVSLPMAYKLLTAVGDDASVVVVGDPFQLESIEAGTVLSDIVTPPAVPGPAVQGPHVTRPAVQGSAVQGPAVEGPHVTGPHVTGPAVEGPHVTGPHVTEPAVTQRVGTGDEIPIARHIIVLDRVHRFDADSAMADFAQAVRIGDADTAMALLAAGHDGLRWVADRTGPGFAQLWDKVIDRRAEAVRLAVAPSDAVGALAALNQVAVLCARRRGPESVAKWGRDIELGLDQRFTGLRYGGEWYPGRPVMITSNDYRLDLFNGDIGVTVDTDDGLRVVFERGGELREYPLARLSEHATVHAMTIHKSQGSQFGEVVVVLPDEASRLLTRELLYTAVTRASTRVWLLADESVIRQAIGRSVERASGLGTRLWRFPDSVGHGPTDWE